MFNACGPGRATALLLITLSGSAIATTDVVTSVTGGGEEFSNLQESLAITYFVPRFGTYPSRDGCCSGFGQGLGFVRMSGTNFVPGGAFATDGGPTSISENTALFSVFGINFGGNGRTTFGLPDLRGTAPRHAVSPGFPYVGTTIGESRSRLGIAQIPAHRHSITGNPTPTEATGGGGSFGNRQPSLGLNYVINIGGEFPTRNSGNNAAPFIGQVALFGGDFAPSGWAFANGQLLTPDSALFSVIGTSYGGDGRTSYQLPDLRDRIVIGADERNDDFRLGRKQGAADLTFEEKHLPEHQHDLPAPSPFGNTELTGQGEAISNIEPSLALNYLISIDGQFPSRDGGTPEQKFLGEITLFAGNFAPSGWAFADGRLLDIAGNSALFSLLGTNFGGDGRTNFALPDLRRKVAIGTGLNDDRDRVGDNIFYQIGGEYGSPNIEISEAVLPSHAHNATVIPLPAAFPLMLAALGLLGCARRKH